VTLSDPNDSVEQILDNIQHNPNPTAPFAVLLVKLSRDAERTARRLIVLTIILIILTTILIVLTAPIAWVEATRRISQDNFHLPQFTGNTK
jgi:hypothetical protein